MCEYCGCQAIASIATLTREHEEALNLVHAAASSLRRGDVDAARRTCAELSAVLGPHTAVEELALFPVMAEDFPDQIGALLADHEVIDAALAEAATGGEPAKGWQLRLGAALALLPGHILREQDGVFPAALSMLTPGQWDRLDAVRTAQEAAGRAAV